MRKRTLQRTYRLSAIAVTTAVCTLLPAGVALADGPPLPPLVVTGGSGGSDLDPSVALDTAKKTACTPQGSKDDFDSWSGELNARVNNDPVGPVIQYVWNTYDSSVDGSSLAYVPDTGCAKGVRVDTQITDVTAAKYCRPVVQSQVFTAYGHQHWAFDDGTKVLVGVNGDPFALPVTYYGDDGSETVPTSGGTDVLRTESNPDELSPYCVRSTSTVTVKTDGYYLNNLDQYIWFACESDEYQILATPTGPQIDYIDTVKC